MWEMYLLGCEMTFRFQNITVLQMQITREIDALPITRDYMLEAERALMRNEASEISEIPRRVSSG